MKVLKLLFVTVLAINSLSVFAKKDIEYIKENNGIIQIGTKSARFGYGFEGIYFTYNMSLELYTDKTEKQYALKFRTQLKEYVAFRTSSKVVINFIDENKQSLHIDSTYTYNDTEYSYIIAPLTHHDIENIISSISSVQFDVLYYDYDKLNNVELGIKDYTTIQKLDKKGWDIAGIHNFRKKLKSFYNDINEEFEKLKANGFIVND